MSDARLFVISGPSGAGKSTLIAAAENDPRVHLAVSATTRARRPGEIEGVHYHFVDRKSFEAMREAGELLEWATVHGEFYGTPKSELTRTRARIVLLDIDVQGFQSIRALRIPVTGVFVTAPSIEDLELRLRRRGTESEEAILRRLQTARRELESVGIYDHVLVNRDLKEAKHEFLSLLGLLPRGGEPAQSQRGIP